jgi:hypothetical protein
MPVAVRGVQGRRPGGGAKDYMEVYARHWKPKHREKFAADMRHVASVLHWWAAALSETPADPPAV